ncbi:NAD(P)-binding protein [Stigmatella aurantiaca]|nr:NAD(P)-binding protein [Stigmatella aurantiaca]EAU66249.1 phytoene dehydrogenase [Stigmatella aurantiaca DW4/3-1]
MPPKKSASSPQRKTESNARVYIYGGGVSGLTAAHELATRGFEVLLFERERALGPRGLLEPESLGGMAKTQYFTPVQGEPISFQQARPKDLVGQGVEAARYFPECWLEFTEGRQTRTPPSLTPSKESIEHLTSAAEFVNDLWKQEKEGRFNPKLGRLRDMQIHVQAFTDESDERIRVWRTATGTAPGKSKRNAKAPADNPSLNNRVEMTRQVKSLLSRRLSPDLRHRIIPLEGQESGSFLRASSSLGAPPVSRNWVRILFYRPQLPGEHGYRFFPSYYRHVFDTMARIPLQDDQGQPSGGSVLDNLMPLPEIGIASNTQAPFLLSWNSPQTGDALSRTEYNRRRMAELNIHSQDLLQFSLRVLRYMLSCPQRRAAEMEELSWWEYLEGYDLKKGTRLYRYGEAFAHLVKSSSRVLAALDGAQGDARTCGNTYVQLLAQALVPTPRNNCTLNGPTSEAWFTHWRTHLERLGVKFFQGSLAGFQLENGRLVAQMDYLSKPKAPEPHGGAGDKEAVYFVVATDLPSAAQTAKNLGAGIPSQLQDYASKIPVHPRATTFRPRTESEWELEHPAWDRLQTISGIQFFFEKHLNIVDGYLYCVDAEWGLSAICSQLVWKERPIAALSAYQSILSVDIGDWNAPSRELKKTASQCSPEQLAAEVLRQLRVSLSARGQGRPPAGFVLPEPDWIHIDDSLEYLAPEEKSPPLSLFRLARNRAPYLVPIAGDWKYRPGPEPWDPTPQAAPPPRWEHPASVWQPPQGGYPVHYDRLVFAGTWTRTFTRMTTMESANESARHAVNAILDHRTFKHPPATGTASTPSTPSAPSSHWQYPGSPGISGSNPYQRGFFPTTPWGDYCRIWNPEINELPDLELLQQQDEKNFHQGLPHPMDMMGAEVLPSIFSQVPGLGTSFDSLLNWAASLGATLPQASHGLLAVLRHLRSVLESAPRSHHPY